MGCSWEHIVLHQWTSRSCPILWKEGCALQLASKTCHLQPMCNWSHLAHACAHLQLTSEGINVERRVGHNLVTTSSSWLWQLNSHHSLLCISHGWVLSPQKHPDRHAFDIWSIACRAMFKLLPPADLMSQAIILTLTSECFKFHWISWFSGFSMSTSSCTTSQCFAKWVADVSQFHVGSTKLRADLG